MDKVTLSQKEETDSDFNDRNRCDRTSDTCQSWTHLVNEVALRIRQTLELPSILQSTVDEVHGLLGCDRVLIYRFEPDWSGQVVSEAVSTPEWSLINRVVQDSCFEASWLEPYQERRYFAIEDVAVANLTPCHAEFLASFQIKANLVIPILEADTLWGLLIAHHCQAPRCWQAVEIDGLQLLAVQVGIAIHQVSLIDQLQVAKATLESTVAERTRELAATNENLRKEMRRCQQTVAELHQHQAKVRQLATIVESSQDAIISKNLEGIITSWNQGAEAIFGYSAEEIVGQSINTLVPPERLNEAAQILQRVHHGERIETYETQRQRKDGQLVDVAITVSPLRDEDGTIVGASKIVRDISARKHQEHLQQATEAALQDSQHQFDSFMHHAPAFTWITDIDGIVRYANPIWLDFVGQTAESVLGKSLEALFPSEVAQEFRCNNQQVIETKTVIETIESAPSTNGKLHTFLIRKFPIYQEQQIIAVGGIGIDVTDRQQAETALKESEQRLQLALAQLQAQAATLRIFYDTSPLLMGVVETSEDDILHRLHNPTTLKFFGIQPEELDNRWASEIGVPPEHIQLWLSHYRQSQASQQPVQFTYEHISPTHNQCLSVMVSFVGTAESGRPQFSYIVQDITERQQLEIERQRADAMQDKADRVSHELKLLENILEIILGGYWDWDIANNEEYLSSGFKRMFGYDDHELPNSPQTWQELIFAEDLPGVFETFDRHIQSHGVEPYYNEVRYRHKDGSIVWVICSGQVIEWDDRGNPLRMIGCHIDITERKRAEAALSQSEATKRALIQAIPDFLVRMRQDGVQLELINTGNVHCVYPEDQPIQGHSVLDIMPADISQERIRLAQQAITTGSSQKQEYFFTQDGQTYHEEARITPLSDSEVLVMVRDISDRKRAELELQSTKEQLELVLKASSEGFWDWNLITNEIYFSPRWKEMLGYTDHELDNTFEMWESVIFEEDRIAALQLVEDYNSGKVDEFKVVQRFRHKNGSTVFILSRAIHLKDADEQVVRMVGSHLDMTDSKRQELALQESEARYRNIIETTLEGVWMLDADGQTSFVNQRMADMLGYDIAAMQHQSFLDFMTPEDQPQARNYFKRRQEGIQEQHSFKFCRQDGSELWTLLSGTPLFNQDGVYQGAIGLLTDITPLVNTQEALKNSELQLSGILNSSLDGIMAFRSIRNDQGQIIDFEWLLSNPTACDIVGKPKHDLIGHRMLIELPGNRDEGLFDTYVQVVESGEPARRQFHYNHDGLDYWFENIAVKLGDGFTVTFRNITQIKQTEQKVQQANQQLEIHVDSLKKRNLEMVMLSKTSDFLQACRTIPEACTVISTLVQPLFPTCSGSIYITCASRNRLERVAAWGSQRHAQPDFAPHDCWGLRRGRLHLVHQHDAGLRCHHTIDVQPEAETLCIPMIAQGETLGLFYLYAERPDVLVEAQQLAQTVAEQIGLAIANLHLRETLQNQSIRDALTGLFNRRYLEESLQKEIARAQRNQSEIGVIMLDVDHFKRFNDTHGHEAGDMVLQAIGKLLREQIRGSDIACRYGGEELTLVFPDSSLQETHIRADEIRVAISQLKLSLQGTMLSGLTASLGVASFPKHGANGLALLQAADAALYRSKSAGRNQVTVAP